MGQNKNPLSKTSFDHNLLEKLFFCIYSTTTTTPGNSDGGDGHPICGNSAGLKPDPDNCEKYYSCQEDGQGKFFFHHLFLADFTVLFSVDTMKFIYSQYLKLS
jgi:hypothetical protein